jgi:uncharacterized membrane protein
MHASKPARLAAAALLAATVSGAGAETLAVDKLCVCWVTSLAADGHAAAGFLTYDNATLRWTRKDGVKALGRNSSAIGVGGGTPRISRDGKVVAATILDATGSFATSGRWTAAGGWQELDHPLPPDGGVMDLEDSAVFGMSGDGAVVTGLYWRPGQHDGSAHASVWRSETGMVGMPTDGGSSRIDGASADGRVLSGWEEDATTGQRLATVWVDGVKGALDPQRLGSEANTVNGDGTILVGEAWNDASQHSEAAMWRWNGASWDRRLLGLGKGGTVTASSVATGVSDDGSVVVGLYRDKLQKFSSGGFVWTAESGLVDASRWLQVNGVAIHPGKFTVMSVSAISADGRVLAFVGQDTVPPYATRTYLVTRESVPSRK